ncbi:hypothetical protein HYN48_01285 [Flavobacterium magnum]|uniref:Transcription regulator BetR N-terminal domain-containing protein n=1 Tax=Flavobacterium magnum TaxID=2162713 RepID=A0A2S0RCL7_9FLAO|nr:hypothetical protein [Flavobacterium magnum]AWA28831.1 hypothetical protein HYN48_01285 [Flavobacterium magnum]
MEQQEKLLKAIRKQMGKSDSINDVVATVLNISYDAAHRRVSGKSKFSVDEAVTLCRHFRISMDHVFEGDNKVLVEKTKEITTFSDMELYFEQSTGYLNQYLDKPGATLYYSAKDIPLFYTIGGTLLSRFKLYVWMNLLIGKEQQEPFEKFVVPAPLLSYSSRMKAVYDTVAVSEIWNDTTINSTLQQILYFSESGLLSMKNALALYEEMRGLMAGVEQKSAENDPGFHVYYNELLILNNNVLVSDTEKLSLFVPYTMLGYFITEDQQTCRNAGAYFRHQIKNSKSLNLSGTRDRKIFFNRAYKKIDYYAERLGHELDTLY